MNILNHIGQTPILKLQRVVDDPDLEIWVKCEFLNPGGSIKDRMALGMIEAAERSGALRPGGTIVDQSTGNTGPALAFVGAVKDYDVQLFLPAQLSSSYNPADRIRIARLYGCRVTSIDLEEHIPDLQTLDDVERAAAFVAVRMAQCYEVEKRDPAAWWSNQLCNPENARAHREGTGMEILSQMDRDVDAWVASVGTGGTLLGVGQTLKTANPDLVVAGVLPDDDPRIDWVQNRAVHKYLAHFGAPEMRFLIEDILEGDLLDREIVVDNAAAVAMANRLCQEEGLFCGMSSGANVVAAIDVAKQLGPGARVVTVLVDRRDRYFAEQGEEVYVV